MPGPIIAILMRLFGEDSPLAAHTWDGRIKGAERSADFLRKDLRLFILIFFK
jgi:hypothetical protein